MADRVEVDAIVNAISQGFDKIAADYGKVARAAEGADKSIRESGKGAAQADDHLERLGSIAAESGLRMAALDARASALRGEMQKLARDMAEGIRPVEGAIRAYDKLEGELHDTERLMAEASDTNKGMVLTLSDMWAGLEIGIRAFQAVGAAGQQFYDILQEGAQIEAARNVFESLSESIGTTADAFLNQLRPAAAGTIADLTLMEGANRFVAMGLAGTAEEAARLTNVASQLGLAFRGDAAAGLEEFALLLANQSLQRLDSFGISAGRVRTRIAELQAEMPGLSRETAFVTAAMEEADITMQRIGNQTGGAAGAMARFETALKNASDQAKLAVAEGFGPLIETMNDIGATEGFANSLKSAGAALGAMSIQVAILTNDAIPMRERFAAIAEVNKQIRDEMGSWVVDYQYELQLFKAKYEELNEEIRRGEMGNYAYAESLPGPQTREQAEAQGDLNEEVEEGVRWSQRAYAAQQEQRRRIEQLTEAMQGNNAEWNNWSRGLRDGSNEAEDASEEVENLEETITRFNVALANSRSALQRQQEDLAAASARWAEYTDSVIGAVLESGKYDAKALETATSQVTLNDIMYESAARNGANAETLALLAIATGRLTEAQAENVLRAAAMQAKAAELGQAIADGTLTIEGAIQALGEFQESLDGINTVAAISELDKLKTLASQIDGMVVTVTAVVNGQGGVGVTVPGAGTLDSGAAPGAGAGGPAGGAGGGTPSGGFVPPGGDELRPPGFARGGIVTGGVHGRDSVLIKVAPGELVLNPRQQAAMMGGTQQTFNLAFNDRLLVSHFIHSLRTSAGRNDLYNPDQRISERGRLVNGNA